jgi:hypothetical protein
VNSIKIAIVLAAGSLFAGNAALAVTADDVKWINRCVLDSAGMLVSQDTKLNYCTCMVNKMSVNETRTVTEWEKVHVKEAEACARAAGWH